MLESNASLPAIARTQFKGNFTSIQAYELRPLESPVQSGSCTPAGKNGLYKNTA